MSKKVAIVTGASAGLGRAFAIELLSLNYVVVGVARHVGVDTWPVNVHQVEGTVADQRTVDAAFDAAAELGVLETVVNCAGQGVFGELGSYSVDEVRQVLEGNLIGLIAFTDRASTILSETGGNIINVMSTASKKLRTAESVYVAAKWGAKAYTRTVRDALKAKKAPVRVFEVYPCGMNTAFWSNATRPVSDGKNFPAAEPIARQVISSVMQKSDSYIQEFTFERS